MVTGALWWAPSATGAQENRSPTSADSTARRREGAESRLQKRRIGQGATIALTGLATYGNTRERQLASAIAFARGDSIWDFNAAALGTYSDIETATTPYTVNRRNGSVFLSLDRRPFDDWSPFGWAKIEGSLESRIALRHQVGVGLKRLLFRDEDDNVSVSLALIHEETRATAIAIANPDSNVWRWSARVRARRQVDGGARFRGEVYYRPLATDARHYTLDATAEAAWPLVDGVEFVVSGVHVYDSEATARGARSNLDLTMRVGLIARLGARRP